MDSDSPVTSPESTSSSSSSGSFDSTLSEIELRQGCVISIEGNIGSGKSTLLAHLREHFKDDETVIFLKEPVDDWEAIVDEEGQTMLQKFYADQEKYSFPFQMMAYISRLALLRDALKGSPNATIISERSLYTDKLVFAKMLFDMKKIEPVCYQIYQKWFDTFASECPIHKVIYVRTEPEICHARMMKRSRAGEGCIPLDYLQSCHNYHEEMINEEIQKCLTVERLHLDGNIDIFKNDRQLEQWTADVEQFMSTLPAPLKFPSLGSS